MVMKTMRFYGWTWQETMSTPISAFWSCYGYIDRLRADESLSRLPESSFGNLDETGRKEVVSGLIDQIGTIVVEAPVFDQDGWKALRNLSN
jgi:hypothetical protein